MHNRAGYAECTIEWTLQSHNDHCSTQERVRSLPLYNTASTGHQCRILSVYNTTITKLLFVDSERGIVESMGLAQKLQEPSIPRAKLQVFQEPGTKCSKSQAPGVPRGRHQDELKVQCWFIRANLCVSVAILPGSGSAAFAYALRLCNYFSPTRAQLHRVLASRPHHQAAVNFCKRTAAAQGHGQVELAVEHREHLAHPGCTVDGQAP